VRTVRRLGTRVGIPNRDAVAWVLYDWANSGFVTSAVTAILPIYYVSFVGDGGLASAYWSYTTAAALAIVTVLTPVVGAVADHLGAQKRFLGGFVALGVTFTGALVFTGDGDLVVTSALFVCANVGWAGANALYDSLLPDIVGEDDIDALSTAGFAAGYLGGGVLLLANLGLVLSPETFGLPDVPTAMRWSMVSVAVWWGAFTLPLLWYVPEPEPRREAADVGRHPVFAGYARLRRTFGELREYRELLVFLAAFFLYADGIGTIIKLSAVYATDLGLGRTGVIGALVMVQFVGIPFAVGFGRLTNHVSTRTGVAVGLLGYVGVTVGGFFITEIWQFWVLAFVVATVQGGTQALSRSLFGSMVPENKRSEFFGFYSVSSKFAGIFGPLLFGVVRTTTGSARLSIVSLLVFFLGGLALLSRVDVEAGRRAARPTGTPADD
jgi:UMF1 family MFS transporter